MTDQTQNSAFTPLPDEHAKKGVPLAKIATKQIAITKADLEKFGIEEAVAKKRPALVDLILKTESMKDEERKYWFQLLPVMSEEQIKKLQNILQNERDQLAELDKKYENEISKLNASGPTWNPEKFKAKKRAIAEQEKNNETTEKNAEEDILNQIENI